MECKQMRGVVGSKGDEMGVESNGSVQIDLVYPMLGVAQPVTALP